MKRLGRTIAALLPIVAVITAVIGSGVEAQTPQKVVFALNWFAVGDHAAYWVALDKGYYKAKGLDVELQNSKGSGDSIAKVDTNRADIGLADAVVVIPRVAQGAKIKVSVLCPGWVKTRISDSSRNRPAELQNPAAAPSS